MMVVSLAIVVPVLNEAEILAENLQALKALNVHEIIIVDGGSRDNTCSILEQSGIKFCHALAGRAVQMNTGFKSCKSDIIIFIHADTIIFPSHIKAIEKVMCDPLVVGGRFDIRLSGKHLLFRMIEFFINLRSRISGISTGDQCQFVRRDVFENMGGFPEQRLMEDIEFSKRLKREGKLACLKHKVITSSRRWEKYGIFKTVLLMWKLRFLYYFGTSPSKLEKIYNHVR